ncbi:ABC transporter permease [Cryptosporangium sp. NPDC051539]|uniref:ABC transporter permease n=1 Tax=Cryptosporangium sp. NPDC051539 TaxID=3363962 RepID=UPI0037BC45CC
MSTVGGDRSATEAAGSLSGPGPVLPLDTEAVLAPASGDEPGDIGRGDAPKIEGRSPGQIAWARLRRDKIAVASAVVLVFFVLVAIFADLIVSAYGINKDQLFQDQLDSLGYPLGYLGGVGGDHWFGLEPQLGRDIFVQLVFGARTSLGIALAAALFSTIVGVIMGLVSGFLGGWVDSVISWITDLLLAFPFIIFSLAAIPIINTLITGSVQKQPSVESRIYVVVGVLVTFGWMSTSRLVRGQVLSLREREFVDAARAAGAGTRHIIFRQLLPNLWAPILVTFSLAVPQYVTTEAALSFLGIGVTEPVPDWGRMIFRSTSFVSADPAYAFFPGIALFLLVLAFNLFGDSLRDALDPRSAR